MGTWRRMATKNKNKKRSIFWFHLRFCEIYITTESFLAHVFGPWIRSNTGVEHAMNKNHLHIKWWIGWRWAVCCKKTGFVELFGKKRLYLCVFLKGFWGICPADDLDILMRRLGMFFGRFTTKNPIKTPEAKVFSLPCFFKNSWWSQNY